MFDPNDYPSPADQLDKQRRKRQQRGAPTTIASDGRWHVIAQVAGPVPFCHRIDPIHTSQLSGEGSVACRCDVVGRALYTPERDTLIYPCPVCWERA